MYTLFFCLIYLLLCLLHPFNRKYGAWMKGQRGNIRRVKEFRETNKEPLVWMHCSSMGEFEQGKPLLETFLKQNPEYKSLVTFFSPSGFIPSRNYQADLIAYLPLDTWFNARKFLKAANPTIVFWIKYDYWKNHLKQIHKRGIPCYLVSATFRPKQIFFRPVFKYHNPLRYFRRLFVQTEQSRQLLAAIGITNVTVTGDTRFDRVRQIASKHADFPIIEQFVGQSNKVLIAGSSWPKDENIIAETLRCRQGIKLILVPHEIEPCRISESEEIFSFLKTVRYSRADATDLASADVLIVDVMGILSSLYRYADAAYIGCGFDHGIHNTLEAAVYGIPIAFGPKYEKFEEAKELIALGGATSINNSTDLQELLNLWFHNNKQKRQQQGEICANYVESRSGTTTKILEYIYGKL